MPVEVDATDFSSVTRRLSGEQLFSGGFDPIKFVWRHWIPRGKVIVLAGAGGVGKSSLSTGLAVARALALPDFLGIPIVPGATVFVTGEDDAQDYGRRIAAWIDHFCEGKQTRARCDEVARAISFIELLGAEARLVERTKRDFEKHDANAEGLAQRIRAMNPRPDLVLIETAARFGGDESNQSHAALISACEVVAQGTGAAVIIVSHTGKVNARENAFDAYAARGGSALADNARATIVFGRMPTDSKIQKDILGRPILPDEKKDFLLVLSRSTFSPPQEPVILKPRSALNCLVLDRSDASPAEISAMRDRKNAVIANAVDVLRRKGILVTVRELRKHITDGLLPGVSFRDLSGAVEDALLDGAIMYGPKRGKTQPLVKTPTKPSKVKAKVTEHDLSDWIVTVPFGAGATEEGWAD